MTDAAEFGFGGPGAHGPTFRAPWEARAFAAMAALMAGGHCGRDEFRDRLAAAIAAAPERPYYQSWLAAAEALLAAHGLVSAHEIDARCRALAPKDPA